LDSKDAIIPLIAESMVAEFVELLPAIRALHGVAIRAASLSR